MADLADALLSEELRALHRQRRSGILELTAGEVTKGIFLLEGRIVFASSTVPADKLGEHLIQLGRISRADFAVAFEAAHGPEKRLGAALVGAGLLSERDLLRLVAQQVENIVLSLFTWTAGEMVFHESAEPIPGDLALDLSTPRLLLEGARLYPDTGRLESALGDLGRRLHRAERPAFDWTRMPLFTAEKSALKGASEGLPIEELLALGPRPSMVHAVYALLVGGILAEQAAGIT